MADYGCEATKIELCDQNAVHGKTRLLDPNKLEGINLGMDSKVISTFWAMLEYYHATGKRHWLMTTYIIVLHLVGFSYCLLGFAALFFIDMDIKRGTAAVMNPICGLQTLFKCWTFSYSTAAYLKLFDILRNDYIDCVPPGKEEAAKVVYGKNVQATNHFVKYAMRWNLLTLFAVSSMPYLRSQGFREFFHIGKGAIVPNKICENEYPFDWNDSPIYEIMFVYEQFAVILAIVTSGAYQAILLFLVMALVGHLRTVGFVMENQKASDFTGGAYRKLDVSAKNKAYKQLIDCIKAHQKITEAGDALAERYNLFLTFHLGTAIIVGIIAIFNSTAADEVADKIKFAVMCVYGLLEVAIYCLCGQLLENASEDLQRQVYMCEWDEMEPRFRKAAQMMMIRANIPISLRAGRLYRVNLETLAAIQQLVYSALTVLFSMVENP